MMKNDSGIEKGEKEESRKERKICLGKQLRTD